MNFNLDQVRRDLCRTEDNKVAKFNPLGGFASMDQLNTGDINYAQQVMERKVNQSFRKPKKTPKEKLQELVPEARTDDDIRGMWESLGLGKVLVKGEVREQQFDDKKIYLLQRLVKKDKTFFEKREGKWSSKPSRMET